MVKITLICLHCGSDDCIKRNKQPLENEIGQVLEYQCNNCNKKTKIEARVIRVGD